MEGIHDLRRKCPDLSGCTSRIQAKVRQSFVYDDGIWRAVPDHQRQIQYSGKMECQVAHQVLHVHTCMCAICIPL